LGGQALEVQRYMGDASHVVGQRALTLATDDDLLFKLLVKSFETGYLSACALNQGSSLLL
jgi:hypothetical protein